VIVGRRYNDEDPAVAASFDMVDDCEDPDYDAPEEDR
jgi:hypothetical protein